MNYAMIKPINAALYVPFLDVYNLKCMNTMCNAYLGHEIYLKIEC